MARKNLGVEIKKATLSDTDESGKTHTVVVGDGGVEENTVEFLENPFAGRKLTWKLSNGRELSFTGDCVLRKYWISIRTQKG